MTGLLYKDFLCVKGKKICLFMAIQFLLVTGLRFFGRGQEDIDFIVMAIYMLFNLIAYGFVLFGLDMALFRHEKKAKEKRYYFSMPISKVQYVREKYLFMLLALYVLISVNFFEGMVCRINYSEKYVSVVDPTILFFQNMLIPFACIVLFVCAIEFAFMFALGTERGMQVKLAMVILLFLVFITFMLFGDFSALNEFNVLDAMEYLREHRDVGMLFMILFAVAGGGSYWLSYLFSVRKFTGREDWLDD